MLVPTPLFSHFFYGQRHHIFKPRLRNVGHTLRQNPKTLRIVSSKVHPLELAELDEIDTVSVSIRFCVPPVVVVVHTHFSVTRASVKPKFFWHTEPTNFRHTELRFYTSVNDNASSSQGVRYLTQNLSRIGLSYEQVSHRHRRNARAHEYA